MQRISKQKQTQKNSFTLFDEESQSAPEDFDPPRRRGAGAADNPTTCADLKEGFLFVTCCPNLLLFQRRQASSETCAIHLCKHATAPQLLRGMFYSGACAGGGGATEWPDKTSQSCKNHFCLSLLEVNMTVNCIHQANMADLEMFTIYKSDYYRIYYSGQFRASPLVWL